MPEQCGHDGSCSCGSSGGTTSQPGFAPHPTAAHSGSTPPAPTWASPVPARRRRHRLTKARIAGIAVLALIAAGVLVGFQISGNHGVTPAAAAPPAADSGAAADPAAAAPADGSTDAGGAADIGTGGVSLGDGDLTHGAVFLQSNDQTANEVVAFARRSDGTLREIGRYPTGGKGTGSFEDSADGIVLGSAEGEASPIQNIDEHSLLFVSNAGSGTITVFQVTADGLEKVAETPSGGHRPVSLTVNNGLLYVLNSGEIDRRLILGPTTALENCAHDTLPSVTGFRITPDGSLQAIPGSTRYLSGVQRSGCAQASFTPDGHHLVVTERIASAADEATEETGVIDTFDVQYDGTLGNRMLNTPSGPGPFGFTFTKNGTLLTSEQNGGFGNPGGGKASSYSVNDDGTLTAISHSVANHETDSCWITVTADQKQAFVASPFGDGRIASYSVAPDGQLTLEHEVASAADGKDATKDNVPQGATDEALSGDSHYLYQLDSFTGQLLVFKVQSGGVLTFIEQHQVFDLEPFGAGGEAAPFGISAF